MEAYAGEIEAKMRRFYGWLSEKDRRRYAAIEAAKLGHGGIEYIARILSCDPKTIRQGLKDLDEAVDPAAERVRKKTEGDPRRVCVWIVGDVSEIAVSGRFVRLTPKMFTRCTY